MSNRVAKYSLFLFLILMTIAYAGPVWEKDATFEIATENTKGMDIYVVSVGEFQKTGVIFPNSLLQDYKKFKALCQDTFFEEMYEMDKEERQHKGCIINDTYQEIFCTRITSNITACKPLIGKLTYDNKLNFKSYFDAYMWDINRSEFYDHIEASPCVTSDDSCTFILHKKQSPYNPFIIIAENEENVANSDQIILPMDVFDTDFECVEVGCDVHKTITLNQSISVVGEKVFVNEIKHTPQEIQKRKSVWQSITQWFASLFE
ncbi:MAG TPA: hypothetical protein VK158_05705 [Acidobacteriota bacterium]|nr:hypothetical protein [Acidobacteriota bacterium]